MRHFNISYTSAFNRRPGRVGHLYQGRYKTFLIDTDKYLLAVSRYIHLNPIRVKAFSSKPVNERWDAFLRYKASSLSGYFSLSKRDHFLNYTTEALAKVVTPVKTGVQDYLDPLEITGFRRLLRTLIWGSPE